MKLLELFKVRLEYQTIQDDHHLLKEFGEGHIACTDPEASTSRVLKAIEEYYSLEDDRTVIAVSAERLGPLYVMDLDNPDDDGIVYELKKEER